MAHGRKVQLSSPLKRRYNVEGVHKEDTIPLRFDLSHHPEWVDGYNITIYDEEDRSTIVSKGFSKDEFVLNIPDYDFGTVKAVAVIEDRSDPNNIDAIESIAYFLFKQFPGGTERTIEGHIEVVDTDDSKIAVQYYSTGLKVT